MRGRWPGTGSTPEAANGWQRERRAAAISVRRTTPCRRTASAAYSEHDGRKRQDPANIGENRYLYTRSRARAPRWGTVSGCSSATSAPVSREARRGSPPGGLEVVLDVGVDGIEQLSAGDYEDVHGAALPGWRRAEDFSNQTFSPVSGDSRAQLFRSDDAETAARSGGRRHQ